MSETVLEQTEAVQVEEPAQRGSGRPALSLSDAAKACGTSRSTIRRKLDGKEFPNAFRDGDDGPWMVPVTDLIASGLKVNAPRHDPEPDPEPEILKELEQLRIQVIEERAGRRAAEEIAAERARALDDLRMAFRMIESSSRVTTEDDGGVTTNGNGSAPREHSKPRRFWQRANA